MNELIKVNYENANRPTVMGRELHTALEVKTDYPHWFGRMVEYGFTENVDYSTEVKNVRRQDGTLMPQTTTDHQVTLDMAKEICMIQRTEKGKQFRQYFIEVEKAWNSPEMVMGRALQIAQHKLEEVKATNKMLEVKVSSLTVDKQIMQPKADYFDELVDRNLLTNIRDTANELGIGQKKFVNFLLEKKFMYRSKKGSLKAYATHLKDGLFETVECFNEKTTWKGTQYMITPKGRETFRLLTRGI